MGLSEVVQMVELAHVVATGAPFMRMVEAPFPLPATKFTPSTSRGKFCTAPAVTLDGRRTSIVGALVMAMMAEADLLESAVLVATTSIALGELADAGAVYSPAAVMLPHVSPVQPCPSEAV